MVDLPNRAFLPTVQCNDKLHRLLDDIKPTGVEVIVHFTPEIVFNTEEYQQFIRTIGPKRQLIANDRNR